jgi:hypothetical protein
MDENLQRLARELRTERCPARVLDRVQEQIARDRQPACRFHLGAVGVALGVAAVAAAVVLRFGPEARHAGPLEAVSSARADQVRVAREASLAMAYIGGILLEAKEHNQTVLLNEAVPRVRASFEAASKIIQTKLYYE